MNSIDLKAQQIIVDAISRDVSNTKKNVLCGNPANLKLEKDADIFLTTQDRLDELFHGETFSTISLFPNLQYVKRLCKQNQFQSFSVECVFAVNAHSDPCFVALDVMAKFRTELSFVSSVSYLTELPAGTYRQRQDYLAYVVMLTNRQAASFDLYWQCRTGARYEAMLPKTVCDIPDIKSLIEEKGGLLSRKSTKRNSCVDVSDSRNGLPLTFMSDHKHRHSLEQAFLALVRLVKEHSDDFPASVIQVKSSIDWFAAKRIERSVLFLQSLNDAQVLDLAVHLTLCKIDFYFSSQRVIVLDLSGVTSATLIRIFQYAEVPIPTSTIQGAFSVSFGTTGSHKNGCSQALGQGVKINVSWGKTSALNSVPAQIKLSDLERIERFRDSDELNTWIWKALQGTYPQKVLCFNEERDTDWYMQFHIPIKSENSLPAKICCDDVVSRFHFHQLVSMVLIRS